MKFASPGQQAVYDRIAKSPCAGPDIMRECGIPVGSLGRHIRELKQAGLVIVIGKAPQAGRDDLREDSPIFALRGTPLLPPMEAIEMERRLKGMRHDRPVYRKVKPAPSSGQKAGRREPMPFRELRRDPMDHMKLAMLTRAA